MQEVDIRSVPQYQISPNFLFWGLFRGGKNRKIKHYAKIRYGRGKDIVTILTEIVTISYLHRIDNADIDSNTADPTVDKVSSISILAH